MADSKIEPRSERRIPVRGFLEGQIEEMDLEPYRRTTFGLDVGGADYENGSVVLLCVWALGRNEPDQGGYMMELSLTEQDVDDLIAQLQNRKSWFHRPTHTG